MSVEVKQIRRFNSMERRPKTLKDFLSENHSNSCSSSGFKSLPRIKPNNTHKKPSMNTFIQIELKKSRHNTQNSSTFQTLVKSIRSILVKKSATMILPRSISRKLSSSSTPSKSRRIKKNQAFCKGGCEIEPSTVKIKDIIRWKSFRDINNVEEEHNQSEPLDFPRHSSSPPLNCMMGSTTTCSSTSMGSSWSDSDFSLSSWEGQNDDVEGSDKFSLSPIVLVGKDLGEPTTKTTVTKVVSTFKEDEQHSPVSVLQIGEDEFSPCFDQNFFNIERRKSIQRLEGLPKFDNEEYPNNYDDQEDEEHDYIEERARELLQCVKSTGSKQSFKDYYLDILLLDFFSEELIGIREEIRNGYDDNDEECEREIMRIAKDWINNNGSHVNKDACIKDMERKGEWGKFEKEKQELALEIQMNILHDLVDEVFDLDS